MGRGGEKNSITARTGNTLHIDDRFEHPERDAATVERFDVITADLPVLVLEIEHRAVFGHRGHDAMIALGSRDADSEVGAAVAKGELR